jgi:hypothetical protein
MKSHSTMQKPVSYSSPNRAAEPLNQLAPAAAAYGGTHWPISDHWKQAVLDCQVFSYCLFDVLISPILWPATPAGAIARHVVNSARKAVPGKGRERCEVGTARPIPGTVKAADARRMHSFGGSLY